MKIHILSQHVSRQISAGEIIYCPASVVKELMENSIDAGSTNISINIEKGGLQSIIVSDNGHGIKKMDLEIALMRFSTSKISVLSDLESTLTLGFRGEALSSISAVSRVTLISSISEKKIGWSLYKEAFNESCILKPISHPVGTTVIVNDLFYNIPIRRNFMKSEKNEFIHIKKIVETIALSKHNINVSLTHNKILVKKYIAANNKTDYIMQISGILGFFIKKELLKINTQSKNMCIKGCLFFPKEKNFKKKINYFYVNYRSIDNNIIKNAIKKAIKEKFGYNIIFSSVLHLKISPDQINVNVHPTKCDIWFHQSRLVYELIYRSITCAFNKYNGRKNIDLDNFKIKKDKIVECKLTNCKNNIQLFPFTENTVLYNNKKIDKKIIDVHFFKKDVLFNNFYKTFGYLLSLINKNYLLIENKKGFFMLSLPMVQRLVQISYVVNDIKKNRKLYSFQESHKIKNSFTQEKLFIKIKKILLQLGLDVQIRKNFIYLCAVPSILKEQNWKLIFHSLCKYMFLKRNITYKSLLIWFAINIEISIKEWNNISIISILSEMENLCPIFIQEPPSELLQSINFNKFFSFLKI